MVNIFVSNESKDSNGPVTTNVVGVVLHWDDILNTTIPVVEQSEEHLAQELLSDSSVIEAVSNVGDGRVMGVELWVDSFNTVDICSVGRVRDSDPPLVGNLA